MLQDQIIFPDEAVFEKVNQASGRVYILKFNTDDRKFFIWMQEPNAEGDLQLCSSVNYYINRPLEFLNEEDPDASIPLQVSEDMVEDDVSSSVISFATDEKVFEWLEMLVLLDP
ncbi:hypothetical protein Pint_13909 [Pistacia integerrima]|uniref:Uncharacterized protein n=1 Tax=Pistacia integerrima TaxID=434235 RepID=A0ACC0YAV7_9ROSI|nr:hypothetical protein Pint_13909 [Pistacia integerrima]